MTVEATVIIPTYQHGLYIVAAVESVLAQTVPCHIVVVDDGSTDGTSAALLPPPSNNRHGVTVIRTEHNGVGAARNMGLDMAVTDYVMFLDADDSIEPTKIAHQINALSRVREAGVSLCDVMINDATFKLKERASTRYNYDGRGFYADAILTLRGSLKRENFIPNMSPLYTRSAIGDVRFPDGPLEDWAFLRAVSERTAFTYIPEVLATYNRGRYGRHNPKR